MCIFTILAIICLSRLALCQDEVKHLANSSLWPGLCTNVSFSYPGWELADWRLADDGGMQFQLTNNANPGTTLSCRRYGSPTSHRYSYVCSDRQTTFTYDRQSSLLTIHGTWICEDTSLKFEGIGNTTLDCPTGSSIPCTSLDARTIRGSLLAPVQISPKPVSAPPGADTVGCTRISRLPSWKVDGLSYQRTLNSAQVEFDLTNSATRDRRHCAVTILGLSDGSTNNDWLPCDEVLARQLTKGHEIETYFRLNHSSNTLELNQTWYCGDLGDRDQYRFTASAAVSPALGVHKLVISVDAAAVGEQKLPPSTLQHPRAFGHSCTVRMLTAPPPVSLGIGGFWFGTYCKNASEVSYVSMSIANTLLEIVLNANAEGATMTPEIPVVSNSDIWYGCNGGRAAAPAGSLLLNCSFAFDRGTNRLSVMESWICADKDNEHPIIFTLTARGVVPVDDTLCHTSRSEGQLDCLHCPAAQEGFNINVNSFYWRSCGMTGNCPQNGSGFNWEEQFS